MALWQILDDLLAYPPTWEEPCFGVRKAPFEVRDEAVVGTGLAKVIWVLQVKCFVCTTYRGSEYYS